MAMQGSPSQAHASWAFASASVLGTSHARSGLICQDCSLVELVDTRDGPVLFATLSDGAGSASLSHLGAATACRSFVDFAKQAFVADGLSGVNGDAIPTFLQQLHEEIAGLAEVHGVRPREFACTLLGAVLGYDGSRFFQVGDGAMVAGSRVQPENFGVAIWPQQGEFANQTNFVTEPDALLKFEFVEAPEPAEELAMFSDGLQALVLDYRTHQAHRPFFENMLAPLRRAEQRGANAVVSKGLAQFLNSNLVNSRTDDDKTLVLASRRHRTEALSASTEGTSDDGRLPEQSESEPPLDAPAQEVARRA